MLIETNRNKDAGLGEGIDHFINFKSRRSARIAPGGRMISVGRHAGAQPLSEEPTAFMRPEPAPALFSDAWSI